MSLRTIGVAVAVSAIIGTRGNMLRNSPKCLEKQILVYFRKMSCITIG